MTTEEYLQKIELLDERIKNKQAELKELWTLATSITSAPDKEPASGGTVSDKVGNTVLKIINKSEEINQLIDEYIDEKAKCIELIETLDKALDYKVIYKHYIEYKKLTAVAQEVGYSYQYVVEVHRNALKKLDIEYIKKRGHTD